MNRVLLTGVAGVALAMATGAQAAAINETVLHDTHLNPRTDIDDENFGSSTRAIVGGVLGTPNGDDVHVPLFRWDLSTVPLGEVAVTDGTITLQVRSSSFTSGVDQVSVHKINSANAGWIQGDGGAGSPDADGEPTWNNFAHPSTPWTGGPGLGNNAGGAGYDAAFTSFTYDSGTMATQVVLTIPQSILNEWIANPAGNAGILMRQTTVDGVERLLQFWALGSGNPAAVLSFETAIPEPSTIGALAAAGLMLGARRRRR